MFLPILLGCELEDYAGGFKIYEQAGKGVRTALVLSTWGKQEYKDTISLFVTLIKSNYVHYYSTTSLCFWYQQKRFLQYIEIVLTIVLKNI